MKIYRVEHKTTGIGPYNADEWGDMTPGWYGEPRSTQARLSEAHMDASHPSVWLDIEDLSWDDDFRSCFTSMRDLFAWFGGWLPVLLRHDFRIVVRNVPEARIREGRHQAVYAVSK